MDPDWKIVVSSNLADYKPFYEPSWLDEITKITNGTTFADATFSLTLSFFGHSQARAMPVTMFEVLNMTLSEVLIRQQELHSAIVDNYLKIAHENKELDEEQKSKAQARFKQLFENAKNAIPESIVPKNLEKFWQQTVSDKIFGPSLYRSELNAYSGLYFAYEDYIRLGFTLLTGKSTKDGLTPKILKEAFDEKTVMDCYEDKKIFDARLIRHAIAHAGGRMTTAIKSSNVKVDENGGMLVITAEHTTALYHLLKERAVIYAKAVVAKLQAPPPAESPATAPN